MDAPTTLKQRAYAHVRGKVLSGDYGEGGRVSEWAVSRELSISRGPVREAVSQLVSEGLLVQQSGYGTFVKKLDRKEIAELCDLRYALEVYAVGKAAQHLTPAMHDKLGRHLHTFETLISDILTQRRPGDNETLQAIFAEDRGIHETILDAARLPLFRRLIDQSKAFEMIAQRSAEGLAYAIKILPDYARQHRDLVLAIQSRNARHARRVMAQHLKNVRDSHLKLYDIKNDPGSGGAAAQPE